VAVTSIGIASGVMDLENGAFGDRAALPDLEVKAGAASGGR
jgi:hypothetical protein